MIESSTASESVEAGAATRLKLTEIFLSIQGEADSVGWPTVFVRLTGCPLRCQYCDTTYAFQGGDWFGVPQILERVKSFGVSRVCVTGGEPLAQKNCLVLLRELCDAGQQVSLETSGALDISAVDARVTRVLDIKTPGSGEVERNRLENVALLRRSEQAKFVICDRQDFEWSRDLVRQLDLDAKCMVLFSPSAAQLPAAQLAQWILDERIAVRLQVQLHKYLWGDVPGR